MVGILVFVAAEEGEVVNCMMSARDALFRCGGEGVDFFEDILVDFLVLGAEQIADHVVGEGKVVVRDEVESAGFDHAKGLVGGISGIFEVGLGKFGIGRSDWLAGFGRVVETGGESLLRDDLAGSKPEDGFEFGIADHEVGVGERRGMVLPGSEGGMFLEPDGGHEGFGLGLDQSAYRNVAKCELGGVGVLLHGFDLATALDDAIQYGLHHVSSFGR